MKFIIFGPPGAGKGTYAARLAEKLGVAAISTGEIFREEIKQKTVLGEKVEGFLNRGELVPDEIVIEVLKDRISRPDSEKGFILDGYPRTIKQAKALDRITKTDAIIRLIVPEWVVIERLSNRRTCRKCGAIYNIKYLKPKKPGICDKCGGELYQRKDDKPKVIRERLRIYEAQTQPLMAYYKGKVPFVDFKCESVRMPPEIAVEKIIQELKRLNLMK